MVGTCKNVVAGGLVLSLARVMSVRQRITSDSGSAAHVVETIGELLQQREMGSQELLNQISQYAGAAVTPGAGEKYMASLKAVVGNIESKLETQVKEGQKATQVKLNVLFKGLEDANAAVNTAKTSADSDDKAWFKCAADEQKQRQAAEGAEKSLTSSRSNEKEACQLQQDNKGFALDAAAGKYKNQMNFACDLSAGNCDAALKTFEETVLKRIESDVSAALTKDQSNYNSLKAACDTKKQEQVAAQSALGSTGSAWSTKRAECVKLASARQSSLCAFGSSAQAKCTAESEYSGFVATTKKAKGDAHSEVDRTSEWLASQTTKCMVALSMEKGLHTSITSADVEACSSKVNFAQDVGSLKTRHAEFEKLAGSNTCAAGKISFYNGQMWNVPDMESEEGKPKSSAYTRAPFTPELNPAAGNFEFCSEAPKEEECYQAFHDGHCASGWMGGNTVKQSIVECEAQCRGKVGCGFFAYAATKTTGTNCALYSLAGSCKDDNKYPAYEAYSLNPKCVKEAPAPAPPAPVPEGACFRSFHDGHCASGWMGKNTLQNTIEECEAVCRSRSGCGFFAYAKDKKSGTNCAFYSMEAMCKDDNAYPEYQAYRLNPKC